MTANDPDERKSRMLPKRFSNALFCAAGILMGQGLCAQTGTGPGTGLGAQPLANTNANGSNSVPGFRGAGGGRRGGIDWAARLAENFNDLNFFTNANAQLPPPAPGEKRAVFIGDSITENWQGRAGNFVPLGGRESCFPGKTNYIGRGHTSETTQQMLVRFRQDIIDLQPKVVVIMAGVNDVAGNTGEYHQKYTEDCFKSMFDLADANHIKVVWVSTLPCNTFFWQRTITDGADKVYNLVQWEKSYAAERGIEFVDAYSIMADENHHMKPGLSLDSVHPTAQGYYTLSKPVAEAIEKILATVK
jgi:lysophospholipase L1-like esterase